MSATDALAESVRLLAIAMHERTVLEINRDAEDAGASDDERAAVMLLLTKTWREQGGPGPFANGSA